MSGGDNKKRQRAPKKWIKYMAIIAGVAVVWVGYNIYQSKQNLAVSSKAKSIGNVKSLAGDQGSTDRYNNLVKQTNVTAEQRAEENGESFMPTMIRNESGIDEMMVVEPVDTVRSQAPVEVLPAGPPQQQQVSLVDDNMLEALSAYTSQWRQMSPVTTTVYTYADSESATDNGSSQSAASSQNQSVLPSSLVTADHPLKTGELFYSVSKLSINSDTPSTPVVAQILSGDNIGGQFFGGFVLEHEHLVLHYTKYVDIDGNEFTVDAYAIDPNTKSAAMRSAIDNHTFKRWGGLAAASFLEGLGSALNNSGTTTIETANSIRTTAPEYSSAEQARIALGKVGERAAPIMERLMDTPPTVTLKPDQAIGVLVVGL